MRVAYPAYLPCLVIVFNRPRQPFGDLDVGGPVGHMANVGQRFQVGQEGEDGLAFAPVMQNGVKNFPGSWGKER